jgi:hypothetical protein
MTPRRASQFPCLQILFESTALDTSFNRFRVLLDFPNCYSNTECCKGKSIYVVEDSDLAHLDQCEVHP